MPVEISDIHNSIADNQLNNIGGNEEQTICFLPPTKETEIIQPLIHQDHEYRKTSDGNIPGQSKDFEEPYEASSDEYLPSSSNSDSEGSENNDESLLPLKRKKNAETWKKNIRKRARISGKPYIGFRNIPKPARQMLPSPCTNKEKHICSTNVNEQQREQIYTEFRRLSNLDEQKQFINCHVQQTFKKRATRNLENSRKTFTNHYSLTTGGQKKTVCREFFMATLNVTDAMIRSSLKKISCNGVAQKDARGKHVPHNKLNTDDENFLEAHITSFPTMESHYCRKSSKKKYLDASLNISIMHRLYKQLCIENNRKPVSLEKYRMVFTKYNLGFHKPKKDQCKKCLAYNTISDDAEKIQKEEEYNLHLKRRTEARERRDEDKLSAQHDSKTLSFNFDLQAVLNTPKGPAGQIFYLRKFAVYNFTIYNLGNQDVSCYVWNENQGNRGANEISSCISDFILSHKDITAVRMMSDGCGGQQKNSIFAAMCLYLLNKHDTLETVDHAFFETGHTEMECDSIHSKIEKKAKHVPVYTPEGWDQLIRDSRQNPKPFNVKRMLFDDFYDFSAFSQTIMPKNIPWRKVCSLRYIKSNSSKVFYKTSFDQDVFTEVPLKRNRGRPCSEFQVQKAYKAQLEISDAKLKDLKKMCNDLIIPKSYHGFYEILKSDKNRRDNLPEPHDEELDDDAFPLE